MKKLLAVLFLLVSTVAHAANCNPVPFTFSAGTTIYSAQVNSNNAALVACINAITPGSGLTGFRNRLINGNMVVDQRNGGAAQNSITSGGVYTLDRMFYLGSQASAVNSQQTLITNPSATLPSQYDDTITSRGSATIGSSDYYEFGQAVEAANLQDLYLGTANSQSMTLSFYAYLTDASPSSAGAWSGSVVTDATSAHYSYVFTYTLNAGAWTYVTVTIPPLLQSPGNIYVYLNLGCGSTYQTTPGSWTAGTFYCPNGTSPANFITTTAAVAFTGLQLEPGTTATPYEQRFSSEELLLSQRYYQQLVGWNTGGYTVAGGTVVMPSITLNTPMYKNPTAASSSTSFTGGCSGLTQTAGRLPTSFRSPLPGARSRPL